MNSGEIKTYLEEKRRQGLDEVGCWQVRIAANIQRKAGSSGSLRSFFYQQGMALYCSGRTGSGRMAYRVI